MKDFTDRIEKLLEEAADCELIGRLASDPVKRSSFSRLALQLRASAERMRHDMKRVGATETDPQFLRREARELRELAARSGQQDVRDGLLAIAEEFETLAANHP